MNSARLDFTTQLLRLVLTVLGSEHRTRVTIGLIIGLILCGAEDYFSAVLESTPVFADLPKLGTIPTLALGLGVSFFPMLFQKRVLPEAYRTMFALIDEAFANGVLTRAQYNLAYYTVIQKAVSSFDPTAKQDFSAIAKETVVQVRGEPGKPA